MNISVGVLAGGKSSRMGQNKALLKINEQTFIEKITKELGGFSEVLISAAAKGAYEELGFEMVYDEHKEIGPIEGIYQVLKASKEDYVFVCGVDMPFVSSELVKYMTEFISSDYDCYCIMDEDHIHPLCAIYSKKCLDVIEKLIEDGNFRLMNILNTCRTKYISLKYTNFDKKTVKNINTKDDYKKISKPVIFAVSAVKNSGKTGLIVKLINEFIKGGYEVAVIKHDGHDYVMDYDGTDTKRFTEAGAKVSSIFSDTKYSINAGFKVSIDDMISKISENGVDIIIIEGMKDSDFPKVEVVRSEISSSTVCNPDSLICVATDVISQENIKCPVFGLDDVHGIFLCVLKYFGR